MIIDRWRNWRPADKRFGEFARTEPPKPPEPTGMIWSVPSIEGFEGAIPAQNQNFSFPDAAWRDYFRLWLSEDGTSRDGYGDLVSPYFLDFSEWRAGNGDQHSTTCPRATFERLMREEVQVMITDGEITGLPLKFNRRSKTILKKTATTRKSGKHAAR